MSQSSYTDNINGLNGFSEINISSNEALSDDLIDTFYDKTRLRSALLATLNYIDECVSQGLSLPYFIDIDDKTWQNKPKTLDIYITDTTEGQALNLEARGKDYATNILSYPSEIPVSVLELMPTLPLGELIICHEVIEREAADQNKSLEQHITHLLIHGVLHLLGFDHERGLDEMKEMEQFEIDILARLNLPNPYVS